MSGWRTNSVAAVYDRRVGAHRAPLQYFVCLLTSVLCLLSSACSKRAAAPPAQVLRISQRNEPATLDPQLATLPDEFFIIRALGEGLLTPNPDGGAPLPGTAERYEVSPDGLTYTFHLRANAKWSNGDPVTALDFHASYLETLHPMRASPKASLFFPLKNARKFYEGKLSSASEVGVTMIDKLTLVLSLENPKADFLSIVASGPWIPRHRDNIGCLSIGPENATTRLSNGPFTLAEWSPNQRIAVRKNPRYWDAAAVKLDEIHFLAFDNGDTEERAFRAGQLDVTMGVPAPKLDPYRETKPAILHTVPLHETRYLAVNTTKAPLTDVRVRRALSLALDRKTLVEKVLKGGQQPAFTFVPAGLGGYQPGTMLTENIAEARRLLAEAGFPGGNNFPKLELSTWGASTTVLEAVQQRWRDTLGIEVALLQREARTHLAALAAGDYDIGFVTAIPDYDSPADLLAHLTSGNPGNYPHWQNPAFDRLVAGAGLPEAEKLLLVDLPVIPLYFNAKNFLLRPTVHGWREDALWTRYYKNVSLDGK